MLDETTTTPIATVTPLNSSTAKETTAAPVTSRHMAPVDMPTSTGESLLGPSNVPLVTAILPPLVLLVLIGSLLILNVVIYARQKFVKKRTLRQDAYYCIVGPPSLPARTINVSCKDSSIERLYWTIADLDVKEDTKNKPNGVDFAVENIIMVKNHADTPNAIINLLSETESPSTGAKTNPSSDCVESTVTTEADKAQEIQLPQPIYVHIAATKNSAYMYSSNGATVPEIGMEINSPSTTAKVNHSLPSDSHCPAIDECGGTVIQDAALSDSQPRVCIDMSYSKQVSFEGEMLQDIIVHTTPDFTNIVAARNPAYGTNVAIAPEIGTEVNVAYGFSSGSEETPEQETDHRHPLSFSTSRGAVAVHDASILMKSNPSYGTNVSTAPEIATQRNLAYHDE